MSVKRWHVPIIIGLIILLGILAIFLQDVVRRAIIVPVSYLFWLLKYYYTTIPQFFIWILLLVIIVLQVSALIARGFNFERKGYLIRKASSSPLESLADWLHRSQRGNYFKWRIANRLGKVAREMNPSTSYSEENSPGEVQRYLDAGLKESFMDYPLRSSFKKKRKTNPIDLDVDKVVSFLESQLEEDHDH